MSNVRHKKKIKSNERKYTKRNEKQNALCLPLRPLYNTRNQTKKHLPFKSQPSPKTLPQPHTTTAPDDVKEPGISASGVYELDRRRQIPQTFRVFRPHSILPWRPPFPERSPHSRVFQLLPEKEKKMVNIIYIQESNSWVI